MSRRTTVRGTDRFVFNTALGNEENWSYWKRALQTGPDTATDKLAESKADARRKAGFGADYNEALRSALQPRLPLSFSLKSKSRFKDTAAAKLDKYVEERQQEISLEPSSVLDAPGLRDDYYLNVLDWSVQDLLAVALNETVYLWDAQKQSVRALSQVEPSYDYISSLAFSGDGTTLSMANSQGCLSTFDMNCDKRVNDYYIKDTKRIGSMATCPAGAGDFDHCLTVGTKIGRIFHFDPRDSECRPAVILHEHSMEVCGLKRGYDGRQIASGGNDNKVCIWDLRWPLEPLWVQEDHMAAMKALDWCPWQRHLLATGAGTYDRRIRFWNTMTNECVREIQCDSQVCGVKWSPTLSELVSTHGFSNNELAVWHYPSLKKVASVKAHESRVLQVALSPDGTTLVTAAANEHLKFWNLFPTRPALRRPHCT